MKYLLHLIGLLLTSNLFSQTIEKIWFDKNDSIYGYYVMIKPASMRVQGALVLLDGYGGNADGFLSETKIHNVAYVNDILTICIPTGTRLYADTKMIELLNKVLADVAKNYGLRKDQFAIGGMSSGGTIVLRYSEMCYENPEQFPIKPKVVFDVDSPVDLIGLYESSEKDLQSKSGGWWLGEDQMIVDRLTKELGDEKTSIDNYNKVSPFYNGAKGPGNEKYLSNVAFRTYHDVDVPWHIQNRRHSIFNTNMLLASELVNRLVLMGNDQAEFVSSKIQGRRSNGQRHPHSWNIVDEIDLVQWVKEKLNFYPDHLAKPYVYNAPTGWTNEIIPFPMDFAPAISYKGFEDLRFAPGWGDSGSYQKFAYTLLWWLDDAYSLNEKILQQNLEDYFTGITRRKALADKMNMSDWRNATAKLEKSALNSGDLETYKATLSMFDSWVSKKPVTAYLKIHIKNCPDKTKTIILFEAAQSPYIEKVWRELDAINESFKCEK